ncbi:MAG: ATP-binding protein [Bacteroidales bacterium]|nr:ATP-binding protein [Bacteroidales bacterium]
MVANKIIGRYIEQVILGQVVKSPDPEFIAVYGRRRVGKTYLVKEYFNDSICFEITGIHKATVKEQLDNFATSLGMAIGMGMHPQRPASWFKAFRQLEQYLESTTPKTKFGKKVVFFDELPWLNTPRSKFLSALEHFWNSWGSRQKNLVLIVCGSAASWMIQNIVTAKGGLHNRLTRQIRLLPFTLSETESYLKSRNVKLTRYQIVEIYMAMGGIPHYLKQIEPGMSSLQIIDKICFSTGGLLFDEFDKLYSSLFDDSSNHIKIIKTLATKRKGMTRNEILESTGLRSGGSSSNRFDELEKSGFIQPYIPFGKKSKDALYWLSDEFSLFYMDWIKNLGKKHPEPGHWQTRINSPKRWAWSGYAFERICIKRVFEIKKALGISSVETNSAPWYYQSSPQDEIPGAQIDFLIDRRDQTINLIEIKFSKAEFIIDSAYAKNLRQKIDVFRRVTNTRKDIFITMISTFGIKDNAYAKELVANSLTLDDLF